MDSLGSLIGNDKFVEPPEVALIKDYVFNKYKIDVAVLVQDKQIVITVPGAALAGTLRMQLLDIQKYCKTDKKLTLRIGR